MWQFWIETTGSGCYLNSLVLRWLMVVLIVWCRGRTFTFGLSIWGSIPDLTLNCRIEDWQVRVGMRIGRLNVHTLLPTMWSLSWVSHVLMPAARWILTIPLWLTKIRWVIIGALNKLQIPAQTTFSGTQAKPSASWKTWYKNILWLIPQEAGNI